MKNLTIAAIIATAIAVAILEPRSVILDGRPTPPQTIRYTAAPAPLYPTTSNSTNSIVIGSSTSGSAVAFTGTTCAGPAPCQITAPMSVH